MVIIGEDASGMPPSLGYCKNYAQSKGVDPTKVFIDNTGGNSWAVTFDAINTYSSSIGLPWNAVLDARSMEYIWSSNAGTADDLWTTLDDVLK